MYSTTSVARSSGLDVSLLGVIVAGVGLLVDRVADAAGTMPHLVRFFDAPADTHHPAVMPQDAALLLLTDPSTTASRSVSGGDAVVAVGNVPTLLVALGAALIVAGPLWARYVR